MSFCPRCGAPTTPTMTFCTSCGETLTAGAHASTASGFTPAPGVPAPMAQPSAPARGPTGRVKEPWVVLLLTLVTLGIYQLIYFWRVSKEIDAYRLTPMHAHKPTRTGILLAAISGALLIPLYVIMLGAIFSSVDSGGEPNLGALGGSVALIFVLAIVALVGYVFMLIGQWRVWSGIEAEERLRNHPKPLSPGLQLVFVLVPYLNLVTLWIALYRTQDHLNGLWKGTTTP